MALKLILGNSGSGKTEYMYEQVVKLAEENVKQNYREIGRDTAYRIIEEAEDGDDIYLTIDNNIQLGIKYDWDLIFKAYKALKCPDDVYNPVPAIRNMIDNNTKWYIGMSKRRIGKTTNFLLFQGGYFTL